MRRDEDTTMGHTMAARLPALRLRTGGPSEEDREKLVEQALGWTLTVLVSVIVTGLGLL
ncbi:SCO1431 family membrane protein [Streptomyces verrucosisporus]|uniref:SCO1431 family membrane protein n=1 Tax=Streptomyces verrucosisporus TaxID=1695161 RepID=UPI0019D1AD02|nr:SCO1431 family membrane protein [Streptomyces verrucosisporus]MBN3931082.1 SCO1431 family membrane protein [Streptomyces verrucosisporus]